MEHAIQNRRAGQIKAEERKPLIKEIIFKEIVNSGGITIRALEERTGISKSSVCARLSDLRDECKIKEVGSVTDPDTHVKNTQYGEVPVSERRQMAHVKYAALNEVRDAMIDDYTHGNLHNQSKELIQKEVDRINEKMEKLMYI